MTHATNILPSYSALFALCVVAACTEGTTPPLSGIALSNTVVQLTSEPGAPPSATVVSIVNGADGTLQDLTATVSYEGQPPAPWLHVALDQTTATRSEPARLTIQGIPEGLPLGAYAATVLVSSSSASNAPSTIRATLLVQSRSPHRMVILANPSDSAQNGRKLSPAPVLELRGYDDIPVPKAGVVVSVSILSGGGSLQGVASVNTDTAGRATFDNLVFSGLIGPKVLRFYAKFSAADQDTAGVVGRTFTLLAGPPTQLNARTDTVQNKTVAAAVDAPPSVIVQDESQNPVSGVAVSFVVAGGGTITTVPGAKVVSPAPRSGSFAPPILVTTDSRGVAELKSWVLSPIAGRQTVSATVQGLNGPPLVFSATGIPGSATILIKVSGDSLLGIVSKPLSTPQVAQVTDTYGNAVSGVTVNWSVGAGGGSVSPVSSVTDSGGRAKTFRTLGPQVGAQTTVAAAQLGASSSTISFAVDARLGGPAQMAKLTGDQQTSTVNTTLPQQLAVAVEDAVGAPVAGVTVHWSTTSGGTFPGGATSLTDGAGIAVTQWRLGTQAGVQTAEAQAAGSPAVYTATAAPGPLSIAQSTVVVAPNSIIAGGAASGIVVTARDVFGNPIPGLVATVVASGTNNTLTQPATSTDAGGQTIASLASTRAEVKTISVSIGAATLGQTPSLTVTAGPVDATSSTISLSSAAPAPVFNGDWQPVIVTVQAQDAFGNAVNGATVLLSTVGGGVSFAQPSGTNGAGIATGTFSSGTAAGGTYPIGAQVNGTSLSQVATISLAASWSNHVQPILGARCAAAGCHDGTINPSMGYANLYNVAFTGLYSRVLVQPGDPVNSYILNTMDGTFGDDMRPLAPTLTPSMTSRVRLWILQGALHN